MTEFRHILFPVDFSDRCRSVRPFVEAVARKFHARLTLLHVVHIPAAWYGGAEGYPIVVDIPSLEEESLEQLETFMEPYSESVKVFAAQGDPAFEIVHFANAHAVDLIMMPTHGYGKFRNLLLGSVTSKVLHDAKCPVWTAAHTEDPALEHHREWKSIMGAIDVTLPNVILIRRYADLAQQFHAKLRLVHAVPGAAPDIYPGMDQEFLHFLLRSARQEIARLQKEAGTNFEVCLEAGPVSKTVRAAALHHDADLILIGPGTMRETFGPLRTNAYAIIRDAPCPVLSV